MSAQQTSEYPLTDFDGSPKKLLVLLKYRPSECRLGGMSSNWMSAPWNRLDDCRLTESRLSDRYTVVDSD